MGRGEIEEWKVRDEAQGVALRNRLAQALMQFHEPEESRRKTATIAANYHQLQDDSQNDEPDEIKRAKNGEQPPIMGIQSGGLTRS